MVKLDDISIAAHLTILQMLHTATLGFHHRLKANDYRGGEVGDLFEEMSYFRFCVFISVVESYVDICCSNTLFLLGLLGDMAPSSHN